MDGLTHARHKAHANSNYPSVVSFASSLGSGGRAKPPAASIGLGGSGVKFSDADQISAILILFSMK